MTRPDERFFQAMFRTVGFAVIGADLRQRIVCWNEQATRLFGGAREQMIGTPLLNAFPAEAHGPIAESVSGALADGLPRDIEFKHVDPGGSRLTLAGVVSPIAGEDGARVGVSIAVRDITNRKRLSQQLAASRRMAALGAMASGVAHHFNNILAGMLTSIDAALSSDNPRAIRRTLERMAESISRATRITHQLLAFARSEHSEGLSLDLNEAVRQFLEGIGPRAASQGITLDPRIEPVLPRPFESHRIVPVLEGLAQNALDAMQPGGRLSVRLRPEGDEAVIEIEDTGSGISAEHLEHIFEPFFTTKGPLGGGSARNVGLGLSAVHGLITELGGRIDVASTPGRGTCVTLRLPLVAPDANPAAPAT